MSLSLLFGYNSAFLSEYIPDKILYKNIRLYLSEKSNRVGI